MDAGDMLEFSVAPIGDYLQWVAYVSEPGGHVIFNGKNGSSCTMPNNTSINTGILSGRGQYYISIWNYVCRSSGRHGVYSLHLGCSLRDGTKVKPGARRLPPPSTPSPNPKTAPTRESKELPSDFKGFPGLAPIDFSGSAFPKLSLGIPLEGTISTEGEVFGYHFDAKRGDSVQLTYRRTSGSLNLGLVLLDRHDKIVFQCSLVTTETLATLLELPTTGQYTVGVARIELLNPPDLSATSFIVETAIAE
jgi:hypothetical protein